MKANRTMKPDVYNDQGNVVSNLIEFIKNMDGTQKLYLKSHQSPGPSYSFIDSV